MKDREEIKKDVMASDESSPVPQKDARIQDHEPQDIMDVIEALPEEYRPMVENYIISMSEEYSGPLPDANMMKVYEKLAPGSTDRCVKVMEERMGTLNQALIISVETEAKKAETEAKKAETEAKKTDNEGKSRILGQWQVFVLFLIFGLLSFFIVLAGFPWSGTAMFGLLAGIGGVLIYKDFRIEKTIRSENTPNIGKS